MDMSDTNKPAEPIALFDLDGTLADFDATMQLRLDELRSPGEIQPSRTMSRYPTSRRVDG